MPNIEFEEPPSGNIVADASFQQEASMYNNVAPRSPNCVFIPLGRFGYISWQSDSSISVLAFMMFVTVIMALLIIGLIAVWRADLAWPVKAVELLGQALLAIVGAVLGSSGKDR